MKGKGHDGDIELLQSIAGGFAGTTICPLSLSLGMPLNSYTAKYRAEFEAYIAKNPNHAEPRIKSTVRPGAYW